MAASLAGMQIAPSPDGTPREIPAWLAIMTPALLALADAATAWFRSRARAKRKDRRAPPTHADS